MKRITYSFLLIALFTGCSSRSELKGSRILIQFRDTIPHEYNLLSVRESALVVEPGAYDSPGQPFIIPFSRINHVIHDVGGKATGTLLGGAAGWGAVLVAAIIYLVAAHPDIGSGEGFGFGVAFISLPAIVIGMATGYIISTDEGAFDTSKAHDRDALRDFSRYPDQEPSELQKIK